MRQMILALAVMVLPLTLSAQRMLVADIFTNSHCSPCASMHSAVDAQIHGTERRDRVIEIYHHAPIYLDDELYKHNTVEPMQRASVLGGISGTPTVYLGGVRYRSGWSGLGAAVDAELAKPAMVKVEASVTVDGSEIVTTVRVQRLSSELATASVYAAVVEDVIYRGRNGVSDRKNVFRQGSTPAAGTELMFDDAGIAEMTLRTPIRTQWDLDQTAIVIAIQEVGGGVVYDGIQVPVIANTTSVNEDARDRSHDQRPDTFDRADIYTISGAYVATVTGPAPDLVTLMQSTSLARGVYLVRTDGATYTYAR